MPARQPCRRRPSCRAGSGRNVGPWRSHGSCSSKMPEPGHRQRLVDRPVGVGVVGRPRQHRRDDQIRDAEQPGWRRRDLRLSPRSVRARAPRRRRPRAAARAWPFPRSLARSSATLRLLRFQVRNPGSSPVATRRRRLHLDHVGADLGKQHGRDRTSDARRHVDDADTVEDPHVVGLRVAFHSVPSIYSVPGQATRCRCRTSRGHLTGW